MKTLLYSLSLAFLTSSLFAQVEHEWNNFAGQPGTRDIVSALGVLACFDSPQGLAVASDGTIYVADEGSHHIRKITPEGSVSVLAGNPFSLSSYGLVNSNTGTNARFYNPCDIAIGPDGNLYVADAMNNVIRKVTPNGAVTTHVGSQTPGSENGTLTTARLSRPMGVVFDSQGNLYIADTGNDIIRKVDTSGNVTTLAGKPRSFNDPAGPRNGTGANALFDYPKGIAISQGNIYVADTDNHVIRKVTPEGVVTTVAGSYYDDSNYNEDTHADGTESAARFNSPTGITTDASGDLLITDSGNNVVRRVTTGGVVTTLAGGVEQYGNQAGSDTEVRFSSPFGIEVGPNGEVYVADDGNKRIARRIVKKTGIAVAGKGVNILHGASPANTTNGTDFGIIPTSGGTKEATFTITNTGTSVLNLTGTPRVEIQGFRKDQYTVTQQPGASIQPSASTTFKVSFDAFNQHPHYVAAVIRSDAANHPTFYFALVGAGNTAAAPDTTKPTVSFITPKNNSTVFTSTLVVSGTAADETNLTQVAIWLNDDFIGNATLTPDGSGSYNFTYNLNLASVTPGKNTVHATAYDLSDNYLDIAHTFTYDPRNSLSVTRVVPEALTETPDIAGTLSLKATPSKNATPSSNQPGLTQTWGISEDTPITLTATAKKNYLFSHWSGWPIGAQVNGHVMTFTTGTADNTAITATFIANPFIVPAGSPPTATPEVNWGTSPVLAGIIQSSPGNTSNSAVAQVTATVIPSKGSVSGKILVDGQITPFKGILQGDNKVIFINGKVYSPELTLKGNSEATKKISQATWSLTGMVFRLQPDTATPGLTIDGDVQPAVYSKKNLVSADSNLLNVANGKSGYYTLVLPAQSANAASTFPQGPGYATVSLTNIGTLKLAGVLADGSKITTSSFLVTGNKAPIFIQLPTPGGKTKDGSVLGHLNFSPTDTADITGSNWRWIRPAVAGTKIKLYTAGWPQGIAMNPIGARYTSTQTVQQSLNLAEANTTVGNATVNFTEGKLAEAVVAPAFNIVISKVVRLTKTPGFTLSINSKTGLFKGTFTPVWTDPATLDKKLPAYQGVILQKTFSEGEGFFISNQKDDASPQSGQVLLKSNTPD